MAKGAAEKKIVYDKILEVFEGAFSPDGKLIRVPIQGESGVVEIKITLTAAKDVLGGEGGASVDNPSSPVVAASVPPTEEEKKNVEELLSRLGI